MIAPRRLASIKSSAGVAFDENIISSPLNPTLSLIMSSVSDEQSTPQPSCFRISSMTGFGVALTAKYSLNPLFHAKAVFSARALSRIPFSSYMWNGVG